MTDGATVTPGGISMDIDIDAPTPTASPAQNEFLTKVGAEYADKPWVKELTKHADPLAELLKQHENVQTLASRKAEGLRVPGEGAAEDEWKAFHKAIGVPENVDDYKYEPPTVPEHLREYFQQDDELLGKMRVAAQKAGVTPQGWKEIVGAFDSYYMEQLEKGVAGANEEIGKLELAFKDKYGERSGAVLENWQSLAKMAPDWAAPVLESLPDIAKTALAAWADAISAKYIKEGKIDFDVSARGDQVMSQTEYADQFGALYAKMRANKPGSAEYESAKSQLAILQAKGRETVFSQK